MSPSPFAQFADEVSRVFPDSVGRVWAVVADLERIGRWSPECTGISWVAPAAGPAEGARFVGRNRLGPIRWRTTCTIESWDPGRKLSYVARHVSGAATRWTFVLTAEPGGTRVIQRFETVDSPRFMMAIDRFARRPSRLRAGMQRTLEAMREAAAGHPAEP